MVVRVGQRVRVSHLGGAAGTVRYVGGVHYAKGEDWVGVELEEPLGKNDGSVKGKSYFACPDKHGVFAKLSSVVAEAEEEEEAAESAGPADARVEAPLGVEAEGLSAADLKRRGNEFFAKNDHVNAIKWYSEALRVDPDNHILYGNRAAAFLGLQDAERALDDASNAVRLNGDWWKGHARQGKALQMMQEFEEAAMCFESAADLATDPHHQHELLQLKAACISALSQSMQLTDDGLDVDQDGFPEWLNELPPEMRQQVMENPQLLAQLEAEMSQMEGAQAQPFGGGAAPPEPGGPSKQRLQKPVVKLIPLHEAVKAGQQDKVRELVYAGADINALDIHGRSALAWACQQGDLDVAQLLIENGARVDAADLQGAADDDQDDDEEDRAIPLFFAVKSGKPGMVDLLLNHGADAKAMEPILGHNVLHQAVKNLDLAMVKHIMAKCGGDLANLEDLRGLSALALACTVSMDDKDRIEMVSAMLELGAQVTAGPFFVTLRKPSGQSKDDLLECLQKADPSATIDRDPPLRTAGGVTVVHLAAKIGDADEALRLLDSFAAVGPLRKSVDDKDSASGLSALGYVCKLNKGNSKILRALITKFGADPNLAQDDQGNTCLHLVGDQSNEPAWNTLLELGADQAVHARQQALEEEKAAHDRRHLEASEHKLEEAAEQKQHVLDAKMHDVAGDHAEHVAARQAEISAKTQAQHEAHLAQLKEKLAAAEKAKAQALERKMASSGTIDHSEAVRLRQEELHKAEEVKAEQHRQALEAQLRHAEEAHQLFLANRKEQDGKVGKRGQNTNAMGKKDVGDAAGVAFLCLCSDGDAAGLRRAVASARGRGELARLLETTDRSHNSPLHVCCLRGDLACVKVLVEDAGDDVNRRSKGVSSSGATPMHATAISGHVGVMRYLLAHGADPHRRANDNSQPVHLACAMDRADIVELLILQADVNPFEGMAQMDSATSLTAFHTAAGFGSAATVKTILKTMEAKKAKRADGDGGSQARRDAVEHADGLRGVTLAAFMFVAMAVTLVSDVGMVPHRERDRAEVLRILIDFIPEEKLREIFATRETEYPQLKGYVKVFKKASGDAGDTLLHIAARCGRGLCVQVLLRAGADITQRNSAGLTAVDVAMPLLQHPDDTAGLLAVRSLIAEWERRRIDADESMATLLNADGNSRASAGAAPSDASGITGASSSGGKKKKKRKKNRSKRKKNSNAGRGGAAASNGTSGVSVTSRSSPASENTKEESGDDDDDDNDNDGNAEENIAALLPTSTAQDDARSQPTKQPVVGATHKASIEEAEGEDWAKAEGGRVKFRESEPAADGERNLMRAMLDQTLKDSIQNKAVPQVTREQEKDVRVDLPCPAEKSLVTTPEMPSATVVDLAHGEDDVDEAPREATGLVNLDAVMKQVAWQGEWQPAWQTSGAESAPPPAFTSADAESVTSPTAFLDEMFSSATNPHTAPASLPAATVFHAQPDKHFEAHFPEATALGLTVHNLMGHHLRELSAGQLDMLREVHVKLLKQLVDAQINCALDRGKEIAQEEQRRRETYYSFDRQFF
ncbi:Ankyrin-1 (ANK-1) (Ankyrin-R) (Erythrocyte ankyrin) [Durusdinium trenchii]|uniref:Ankyrin-1 (ANK-1) (Ankyrin-R) (Erythrocyte ankyrin) n=1 Tax=Durusdinium trenchii TaxID=1381693 RepID=A0ABP0SRH9_9DINO